MSKTTNSNMTGLASPGSTFNSRISTDADAFDRNDVDALGSALDNHDHTLNKGLPAGRIGTSAAPVTVTGTPSAGQTLVATSATAAAWSNAPTLSLANNALGADVALNNTGTYFDGPSMAQGSTGTWFASGTVTLTDTGAAATFKVRLWDGTTIISETTVDISAANKFATASLSGYLATPAANIRISVADVTNTTGKILFNSNSSASKTSTVFGIRVA